MTPRVSRITIRLGRTGNLCRVRGRGAELHPASHRKVTWLGRKDNLGHAWRRWVWGGGGSCTLCRAEWLGRTDVFCARFGGGHGVKKTLFVGRREKREVNMAKDELLLYLSSLLSPAAAFLTLELPLKAQSQSNLRSTVGRLRPHSLHGPGRCCLLLLLLFAAVAGVVVVIVFVVGVAAVVVVVTVAVILVVAAAAAVAVVVVRVAADDDVAVAVVVVVVTIPATPVTCCRNRPLSCFPLPPVFPAPLAPSLSRP